MSFIGQAIHIFKNDLRRFWPALLGLGTLMVVHVSVGIPASGSFSGFRLPIQAGAFQVILAAFAVAVIQQDGVANDKAFWATRPLSSGATPDGQGHLLGPVPKCRAGRTSCALARAARGGRPDMGPDRGLTPVPRWTDRVGRGGRGDDRQHAQLPLGGAERVGRHVGRGSRVPPGPHNLARGR